MRTLKDTRIAPPKTSRPLSYLRRARLVRARKDGLWVHYELAPLDDAVMRVLMGAVTHCLCHVEAVGRDRRRLEKKTGCGSPGTTPSNLECCR